MEKFIKVNSNYLLSDENLVLTQHGWQKAINLRTGDKVLMISGKSTITNIMKCGKRPAASVVGKTNITKN